MDNKYLFLGDLGGEGVDGFPPSVAGIADVGEEG